MPEGSVAVESAHVPGIRIHIGHFPAQFSDERGGSPEAEGDEAQDKSG